jgi:hypothetical protein
MFSLIALSLGGCTKQEETASTVTTTQPSTTTPQTDLKATTATPEPKSPPPVITFLWSFYTSWSLLAAACDFGLINENKGEMGSLEKEHNVDIVLIRQEYVQSMTSYQSGVADGVVVTNTDALSLAYSRKKLVGDATVAVFPTSWSDGADKILVENTIKAWADLMGVTVKGAEFSVSHYLCWRCCQINNCDYTKFKFENLDPVKGAPLFANDEEGFLAFVGWSPETFVVLDRRQDVIDICNSSMLEKYEIVDLAVMGQDAIDKPGGKDAIWVLSEAMNLMAVYIVDPTKTQQAHAAMSRRFNNLSFVGIDRALVLTKLLPPRTDWAVLSSNEVRKNMKYVDEFSIVHNLTEGTHVPYGWGTKAEAPTAVLRFDTSFLFDK